LSDAVTPGRNEPNRYQKLQSHRVACRGHEDQCSYQYSIFVKGHIDIDIENLFNIEKY